MQALSLQAIFLFYGIFLFSTVLLISWLFRRHPDTSARLWITATLMTAVATSVTAWRTQLPDWLGFQLPNTIQVGQSLLSGIAIAALMGPVRNMRLLMVASGIATLAFGIGLAWLSQHQRDALVIYVSLANGLGKALPSLWLMRGTRTQSDGRLLKVLLHISLLIGLLWLARIPVFLLGQGAHAMDPQLPNWLIFVSMLVAGILLQFAYIGVRFSHAYESRMTLTRMRERMDQIVRERDDLLRLHHAPSGALASQITHEINQPLAAIRLSLETAAAKPFHRLPAGELEALLQDIDRISTSLSRARALAGGPAPQLCTVPAKEFIASLALAAQAGGVHARFESAASEGLLLRCDAGLLAAAIVAALQHLVEKNHDAVSLALAPASGTRVQLTVRAQAEGVQDLPDDLQVLQIPETAGGQAADIVLDLLTLDHLVRAHAGHMAIRRLQTQPPQLLLEVTLPLQDAQVIAATVPARRLAC